MPVRRVISTRAAAISSTATQYASPIAPYVWSTDINAVQARWLAPTYFRGLYIVLDTPPGAGDAWTFTFVVDGVETLATLTISGSETEGEMEDRLLAFVPRNALVALKKTATGTPAAAGIIDYGLIVDGVETRVSCYGGAVGPVDALAHFIAPGGWYPGVLGYVNDVLPAPFTLDEWGIRLSAAPGAGASRTFIVRSAAPNLSQDPVFSDEDATEITISGTDVEGSVSPGVTWPAGTLLQLIATEAGSPAAASAAWCVRGRVSGADGQSIVQSAFDPVIKHDGTGWYTPNGNGPQTAAEADSALTVRAAFELRALYMKMVDGTFEGTELFMTTRKNGADTALVANLAGPDIAGEYGFVEGVAAFEVGATWDMQASNGGLPFEFGHNGQWSWLQYALAEAPTGEIGPLLHIDWPRRVQL